MLTYLLEHTSTLRDLSDNTVIKDGLDKDENSAVLALDTQILRLKIDVKGIDLIDTTLGLRLLLDPVSKLIVDSVTTALAFLIILVSDAELLLEIARE